VSSTYVIYGDITGTNDRLILQSHDAGPVETFTLNNVELAYVEMGPRTVCGVPTWQDPTTGDCVVYAGEFIEWGDNGDFAALFGWQRVTDAPAEGLVCLPREVDVTFLMMNNPDGRIVSWTKTIWLPSPPEPLQELTVQLSEYRPNEVWHSKVLECDMHPDKGLGSATYAIASVVGDPPTRNALVEEGWERQTFLSARVDFWQKLEKLSRDAEVYVESALGRTRVIGATVNDPDRVSEDDLQLLPESTRLAIQGAIRERVAPK
jgi:hypothetical protein